MKCRWKQGFTLVEVVVAFAVLAIISGTLLQIFVTATMVNQNAYEIDKANALAIEAIEKFKAAPGAAGLQTIYYNQQWQVLDPLLPGTLTDYIYKLDQTVTDAPVVENVGASYFADIVYTVPFTNPMLISTGNPPKNAPSDMDPDFTKLMVAGVSVTPELAKVKSGKVAVLVEATGPFTLEILNTAQLTMTTTGAYSSTDPARSFELAIYISGLSELELETLRNSITAQGAYSTSLVNAQQITAGEKQILVTVTRKKDAKVIVNIDGSKYNIEQN